MTNIDPRPYGGLGVELKKRDISRTTAFHLRKAGLLDTFKIGSKVYVFLDSLDSLPQRLAEREKDAA